MAYFARMQLDGLAPLLAALRELGSSKARAAVRRGLEAATTPVLQAARRLVPVDSRQLRRSLGRKVKTYRSSGTTVVVIGPRAGFKASVVNRRGRRVLRNPTRYAHLVERGHRIAAGGSLPRPGREAPPRAGRQTGTVGARPFLGPALEQNRSVVLNIFRRHVESVLLKGGR